MIYRKMVVLKNKKVYNLVRRNSMKNFSSATLAKLILDYRKENKMSQENLATESGINRSILSKIEQEEHIPSITQIESLAKIISFDIANFYFIFFFKK